MADDDPIGVTSHESTGPPPARKTPAGEAAAAGGSTSVDNLPTSLPAVRARSIIRGLGPQPTGTAGRKLKDLASEPPLPPIQMGSDRYHVVREVGAGGMGTVYLVIDQDLKRRVALKMVRRNAMHLQDRFVEEAQIIGQLQHPNIVPVYEIGITEERQIYYTMPLLRGQTLSEILNRLRTREREATQLYTLARLVQIFLQIAQAMTYAHAKGVLHRDLKPANIMLGEHGEVQVLDWGLSKVLDYADGELKSLSQGDSSGAVVGTPWYMSPEQAAGEKVDERTDIYALGVMLYEILTLERPFDGRLVAALASIVRDEPISPRARAPGRDVPVELERICLRAMAKQTANRHASARELLAEVEGWLEGEADRGRRRQRADERVSAGRAALSDYLALRAELDELEGEAVTTSVRFQPWQPVAEKAELYALEERVHALGMQVVRAASRTVETLTEALGFDRDHRDARGALAEFYWARFLEAEARRDDSQGAFLRELVGHYHDGKYERELHGHGTLVLDSERGPADVTLYELAGDGLIRRPVAECHVGPTPLGPLSLPMGSYLAVVRKAGQRDAIYPIQISRNREWRGTIRMRSDLEIGSGWLYIPAGPFRRGGDPEARGWSVARAEQWVDDYFIATHPVTMGEYFDFLEDLERVDPGAARRRAPRAGTDPAGRHDKRARGKEPLPRRADWPADLPAFGVSWYDASAYCAWRSQREGWTVRLPTEVEWEKAARGVDGRWYPWGDRFDASLCNVRESRREGSPVAAIDRFPTDVSVYGLRGAGGNVQDWTATAVHAWEGRELRVVRGGAWALNRLDARCAYRDCMTPDHCDDIIGFRVARAPVDGESSGAAALGYGPSVPSAQTPTT